MKAVPILLAAFVFPTRNTDSLLLRNPSSDALIRKQHIYHAFKRPRSASSLRSKLQMSPVDFLLPQGLSDTFLSMSEDQAETLAGPLFGASLFPYLAFLYLLNVKENDCPKGVTVGFATCLLFVFLTIPAAILSKLWYGVSLADSDWLHGSAESVLTITNLVTVVAFRQALQAKQDVTATPTTVLRSSSADMPLSATSYIPMVQLMLLLVALSSITILVPAFTGAEQHTPYLNGFMDLPSLDWTQFGAHAEPDNALTIATWIIHVSSLVEFLVAMGYCWRWGDIVKNPTWKGLTWGLIPLHSSGITACTYHLLYNRIPVLVPLQAFLTCVGNTTAAFAALRIALSNGWKPPESVAFVGVFAPRKSIISAERILSEEASVEAVKAFPQESATLVGFEDLGDVLQGDNDYSFLLKLFVGCAVASYVVKYGELFVDFPFEARAYVGLTIIMIPSALNAFKWWKRSQDPTFEGWF